MRSLQQHEPICHRLLVELAVVITCFSAASTFALKVSVARRVLKETRCCFRSHTVQSHRNMGHLCVSLTHCANALSTYARNFGGQPAAPAFVPEAQNNSPCNQTMLFVSLNITQTAYRNQVLRHHQSVEPGPQQYRQRPFGSKLLTLRVHVLREAAS